MQKVGTFFAVKNIEMFSLNFFLFATGTVPPCFVGINTFMGLSRLVLDDELSRFVDIACVDVPWDGGITNQAGARHGSGQIRDLSTLARNVNRASGLSLFELCRCADMGGAPVNPVDLVHTLQPAEDFLVQQLANRVLPLTAGCNHLVSLSILRAIASKRPVGMVHFDAHTGPGTTTSTATNSPRVAPAEPSKKGCSPFGGRYRSAFVVRLQRHEKHLRHLAGCACDQYRRVLPDEPGQGHCGSAPHRWRQPCLSGFRCRFPCPGVRAWHGNAQDQRGHQLRSSATGTGPARPQPDRGRCGGGLAAL